MSSLVEVLEVLEISSLVELLVLETPSLVEVLEISSLLELVRVVVVLIITETVLEVAGYLLLKQLHAELICVARSPSLHSVVSEYD